MLARSLLLASAVPLLVVIVAAVLCFAVTFHFWILTCCVGMTRCDPDCGCCSGLRAGPCCAGAVLSSFFAVLLCQGNEAKPKEKAKGPEDDGQPNALKESAIQEDAEASAMDALAHQPDARY